MYARKENKVMFLLEDCHQAAEKVLHCTSFASVLNSLLITSSQRHKHQQLKYSLLFPVSILGSNSLM